MKTRKIRVYPTPEQKLAFRIWFDAARWAFNKAKEICDKCWRLGQGIPSKYKLRDAILAIMPKRLQDVPYLVKAGGVLDYLKAHNNAITKYRKTGKVQHVRFRTRKGPSMSCRIKPESFTSYGVYASKTGAQRISEYAKPAGECILKLHNDRYTLYVPVINECVRETQADGSIVAIDPGVRTFASWYSGDACGKIGDGDFGRICRLCTELDSLISRRSRSRNHRQRRSMKKAESRLRNRIHDLIDELHKKAALFFVCNFDVILLPTFETQSMVQRAARKIRSNTVRSMLTFSHFRFKAFIKHKAQQHGKIIIDVNEAYTSQTLSWTGEIKLVGSAKYVRSGKGKNSVVVDRDYNGARGILLRALRASSLKISV